MRTLKIRLVNGGAERVVGYAYGLRMVSMGAATVCPLTAKKSPEPEPVDTSECTPLEGEEEEGAQPPAEAEKPQRRKQRQPPAPIPEVMEDVPGGADS